VSLAERSKAASRGASRDMSPEAVGRRFDILVELDRTARALCSAARAHTQRAPQPRSGETAPPPGRPAE